jgi:hypothetical protein
VYDDGGRMEQGAHGVVAAPCVSDPRQRRSTDVETRGRQPYGPVPSMPWGLWTLARVRTMGRLPR